MKLKIIKSAKWTDEQEQELQNILNNPLPKEPVDLRYQGNEKSSPHIYKNPKAKSYKDQFHKLFDQMHTDVMNVANGLGKLKPKDHLDLYNKLIALYKQMVKVTKEESAIKDHLDKLPLAIKQNKRYVEQKLKKNPDLNDELVHADLVHNAHRYMVSFLNDLRYLMMRGHEFARKFQNKKYY